MIPMDGLPMAALYALLAGLALIIVVTGARLAATADKLADATGWGEATVGAVLLGGATSLPGIVASVTAAATGHPALAISNAIGGIAVQTFFLTIADMAYPRANLEHAAADVTNLFQATHLVAMLALPLIAVAAPYDVQVLWFSPWSLLLIAAYGAGVRAAGRNRLSPMWSPRKTHETRQDEADASIPRGAAPRLFARFALLGATTGVAGYILTGTAIELSARTGLSETAVGGLITGVITSLPELVTSVAAVRRGALVLAVGGIIGGNAFDVLFLALADLAYIGDGTLYQAITATHRLVIVTTILMTAVLLMGLVARQKGGGRIGIGIESWVVVVLYGFLATTMAVADSS